MRVASTNTVTSFKYLGSVITDEGSKPELLCRIAQATAALTRSLVLFVISLVFSALISMP